MELPSDEHREVARLMRETAMTGIEIAARTGLPPRTVSHWNRRYGWRETAADTKRRLDPGSWPPTRRLAVARLYALPGVEPTTLSTALGGTVKGASALFRACGFAPKPGALARLPACALQVPVPVPSPVPSPIPPPPAGPDGGDLPSTVEVERALRAHVARQIARFDEALRDEALRDEDPGRPSPGGPSPGKGDPGKVDSARVLRDLGGLKRLLDDLLANERERAHATRRDADTDEGRDGPADIDADLPALRAAIAARYAACLGERPDAGLPGGPAAGDDPGACL